MTYKQIPIAPKYEVTESGHIRHRTSKREVQHRLHKNGHYYALLNVNGQLKPLNLHKIVATTYLPQPKGSRNIVFKDFNNKNHHASNLAWVNRKTKEQYYLARKAKEAKSERVKLKPMDTETFNSLMRNYKHPFLREHCEIWAKKLSMSTEQKNQYNALKIRIANENT